MAGINADGHPSYSPDRKLVVTDTYPDKSRVSSIKVMSGEGAVTLVRVFRRLSMTMIHGVTFIHVGAGREENLF